MNGDEKRVWILLCSRSFLLVVALSHSSLHIFHQKPSPKGPFLMCISRHRECFKNATKHRRAKKKTDFFKWFWRRKKKWKKCNAPDEAVLVKGDRGGKKEQPKSYQTFFYSSTLSARAAFYASFRFTLCTFSSSNDGNGFLPLAQKCILDEEAHRGRSDPS